MQDWSVVTAELSTPEFDVPPSYMFSLLNQVRLQFPEAPLVTKADYIAAGAKVLGSLWISEDHVLEGDWNVD